MKNVLTEPKYTQWFAIYELFQQNQLALWVLSNIFYNPQVKSNCSGYISQEGIYFGYWGRIKFWKCIFDIYLTDYCNIHVRYESPKKFVWEILMKSHQKFFLIFVVRKCIFFVWLYFAFCRNSHHNEGVSFFILFFSWRRKEIHVYSSGRK